MVALYRLGFPEARKATNLSVASPSGSKTAAPKIPGGNSKIKPTPDGFLVTPLMEIFEQAMAEDKEGLIEKVRGIYGFKVGYRIIYFKNFKIIIFIFQRLLMDRMVLKVKFSN